MTNEIAIEKIDVLERVVVMGDLSSLAPDERVKYYKAVCESVGLNPLTRPFDYITLNGKLTLYARKDATDQLRKMHGVSITKLERDTVSDVYSVTAYAQDRDGRVDVSTGAVSIKGLGGDSLANAIMKAETKSKRRVALSICGLGMLDETEIETIREASPTTVTVEGEILSPVSHSIAPPEQVKRSVSVKHNSSSMTIEEAEALWSETSGCTIGCLTNEELVYRLNSLLPVKKPTASQAEKIAAIRLILEAREKGRPVQVAPEPETVGTPDQGKLV